MADVPGLSHSRGAGRPGFSSPRNQWHTFWNAADSEARILEIISPAGLEQYFEELIALFAAGTPDPAVLAEVASRYGLEVDLASIPTLSAEHGLG